MSTNTEEQTTYADVYREAVTAFAGQTPTRTLENTIAAHYQDHPIEVTEAITNAADAFKSGRAHSPWGIVASNLQRANDRRTITADRSPERDKAVRLAETWIRNAGLHCPDEPDLLDALFGPHGDLKAWRTDTDLRERMTDLWRAEQPRLLGAQADPDADIPFE